MNINQVLQDNSHLNFVQRILTPEKYPVMDRPDLGPGSYSTHLMSWSTAGDKNIVYPEIIQDPKTNKLKMLTPDEAVNHAIKTGEYLNFKTPKEADEFSKNYKQIWDKSNDNLQIGR